MLFFLSTTYLPKVVYYEINLYIKYIACYEFYL